MARNFDFDREKFSEAIVYFARRLGPEAALGRVKLAKLLTVSDFVAFTRLGRPVTGATYEKWDHGHFPREFVMVEKDLIAEGVIAEEDVDYYGKTLRHVTAQRDPNLANFDEDEIAIMESALRTFGYESASYLSALSHREPGWQLADMREVIPYETALIGTTPPSEAIVKLFQELHEVAA